VNGRVSEQASVKHIDEAMLQQHTIHTKKCKLKEAKIGNKKQNKVEHRNQL
jgi:hypothetical protein